MGFNRDQFHLVIKSNESTGRVAAYRAAWPHSRCVIIVRHPCGQIASRQSGIRRGFTPERFAAMSSLERLAWVWALPNEKAMEEAEADPACRVVRYEDLCERPIEIARELFAHCGIAWDGAVERFIGSSTDATNSSDRYYSVFRDPSDSAQRWKKTLTAAEIDTILATVADTRPGRLFA
jgi:hypothetical protein